jgi:hypothetical protein
MRLFHQQRAGEWEEVIAEVVEALGTPRRRGTLPLSL